MPWRPSKWCGILFKQVESWNNTPLYTFIYFHYGYVRAKVCEIHLTQLGSFETSCFCPSNCELRACVCVCEVLYVSSHSFYQQLWGWLIPSPLMHYLQWWKVLWCVLDLIFFLNMDINTVSTSFISRPSELFNFCISLIFHVLNFEIYSTTEHSGYWLLFFVPVCVIGCVIKHTIYF